MSEKTIFIDTEAFFHHRKELVSLVESNFILCTNSIVIYEFVDIITDELETAKQNKNTHRIEVLTTIRDRFPQLIIDLNIEIKNFSLPYDLLQKIYGLMEQYKMNIGDIFHILTIQEHNIEFVLSNDGDWKRAHELVKLF